MPGEDCSLAALRQVRNTSLPGAAHHLTVAEINQPLPEPTQVLRRDPLLGDRRQPDQLAAEVLISRQAQPRGLPSIVATTSGDTPRISIHRPLAPP
jgi:hypothetical protein